MLIIIIIGFVTIRIIIIISYTPYVIHLYLYYYYIHNCNYFYTYDSFYRYVQYLNIKYYWYYCERICMVSLECVFSPTWLHNLAGLFFAKFSSSICTGLHGWRELEINEDISAIMFVFMCLRLHNGVKYIIADVR